MDKKEKFEILAERNKQNELTFSFIRSIAMVVMGLLAFTMLMGLFTMFFFDDQFLEESNLTGTFGDLKSFLITVLALIVVNVGGLIWFSKGEIIGFVGYVLTNLIFAGFFGLWVVQDFEIFALLFLLYFLSFSVLIGYYGLRRIKFKKEIEPYRE
ncbi:MAG: hypothetical protein KDC84_06960 [Crocinitomicaceae bacterium]|nr:hypothetical protein [Crocinitomicaceae bacterium]